MEPGFYWMRHTVAVIENDTLADERWIERPVVARFDGRDWFPFEHNALADQFQVEVLSERLVPPDLTFFWRGSVSDLATDIAARLTVDQLAKLSGEVALAWKRKAKGGG